MVGAPAGLPEHGRPAPATARATARRPPPPRRRPPRGAPGDRGRADARRDRRPARRSHRRPCRPRCLRSRSRRSRLRSPRAFRRPDGRRCRCWPWVPARWSAGSGWSAWPAGAPRRPDAHEIRWRVRHGSGRGRPARPAGGSGAFTTVTRPWLSPRRRTNPRHHRRSTGRWEADVVLADGGTVHVRPIRPEDAEAFRSFHAALSAESRLLPVLLAQAPPERRRGGAVHDRRHGRPCRPGRRARRRDRRRRPLRPLAGSGRGRGGLRGRRRAPGSGAVDAAAGAPGRHRPQQRRSPASPPRCWPTTAPCCRCSLAPGGRSAVRSTAASSTSSSTSCPRRAT